MVDDETALVDSLKTALETQGYQVLVALEGVAAVEIARREIPHLILLDLTLPQLDGIQVLRQIRSDEQCRQIPVVVMTGRTDPEELASTLEDGASSYYIKPMKVDTLMVLIQTLLDRKPNREAGPP